VKEVTCSSVRNPRIRVESTEEVERSLRTWRNSKSSRSRMEEIARV